MFRSEKAVSTYFERVNWRMKKKKKKNAYCVQVRLLMLTCIMVF